MVGPFLKYLYRAVLKCFVDSSTKLNLKLFANLFVFVQL